MLNETLETIARKVEGTISVLVIGLDGFVIEQNIKQPSEISSEAIAAEVASLVRQGQSSALDLGVGVLDEMTFRTGGYYVLIQKVTDDYFLCVLLSRGGNYGRARFEMRKAGSTLVGEFAV